MLFRQTRNKALPTYLFVCLPDKQETYPLPAYLPATFYLNHQFRLRKAARAERVDKLSHVKMNTIEPPMGRAVENILMARRIHNGNAPKMPMHCPTATSQQLSENRKKWYKEMRGDACRDF